MDVPLQNGQVPSYGAIIAVQLNLGGALIGGLVSTLLFGVILQQALSFFLCRPIRKQPLDSALVGLVTATSAGIFIAEAIWLYGYFVTSWGTTILVERYFSAPWIARLALENLVICLCQIFFARRAWRLYQRNWYLAGVLGVCIAGTFAAGLYQCVKLATSFNTRTIFPELNATMAQVSQAHYISGAIIDMIVCIIISSKLSRVKKSANGFNQQTESILMRLLIASLTTAGLTTVFAIITATFGSVTTIAGALFVPFTMILARIIAVSMIFSVSLAINGDRSDGMSSTHGLANTSMHQQSIKPGGTYQPSFQPSRSMRRDSHAADLVSVRLDKLEQADEDEKADDGH